MPDKLPKDASAQRVAARQQVMKERKRMQKEVSNQEGVRARPSKEQEAERRAAQRYLKDAHALVASIEEQLETPPSPDIDSRQAEKIVSLSTAINCPDPSRSDQAVILRGGMLLLEYP